MAKWCESKIYMPYFSDPCLRLALNELFCVLKNTENNNSSGFGRMPYEFNKNAPIECLKELLAPFYLMFLTENIPGSLRRAIITPLYKKGDANDISNYRRLSMLDSVYLFYNNTSI